MLNGSWVQRERERVERERERERERDAILALNNQHAYDAMGCYHIYPTSRLFQHRLQLEHSYRYRQVKLAIREQYIFR